MSIFNAIGRRPMRRLLGLCIGKLRQLGFAMSVGVLKTGKGQSDGIDGGATRRKGIVYRTALVLGVVIAFTLSLFILLIIPYQRNMLIERLKTTAEIIATSIEKVTVTSIVVEDYSTVVEHCIKVVNERPSVLYLVITRRDGFSLVHTANRWRQEKWEGYWNPASKEAAVNSFIDSDLVGEEVFHYSHALGYSSIDWGWINIGLSIEKYDEDLRSIYTRTILLACFCLLAGWAVALLFARRLIRPILSLDETTQRIAGGDLAARAHIDTNDELENLAHSFNRMTDALQAAHGEQEKQVAERTAELMQANLVLQKNIEEREEIAHKLLTVQGHLQHLLTASPAVIYSCDPEKFYSITFISDNVQKVLGYPARQFREIPEFWNKLIHMEDMPRVLGGVANVVGKGYNTHQYRMEDRQGNYRWIQDEMRLVSDEEGRPLEIVGSFTDITEHRQAQEARRQAEQELESQRALSMRSDRLRSLGEMAAGIAHELNQPLMGVRGLAEHILIGLERGWKLTEGDLQDRASRIVEQADRMVHIIEHIRLFAREAGNPELIAVQVNDVVKSAFDMLGAQFRSHGLELEHKLGVNLPSVRANPYSLEEVLLNLLSNARDALDDMSVDVEGSGRVVVSTSASEADGRSQVLIEVVDTGVGIPQNIIDRVFDPFFTTKDPDKGTGLGLAISRSIIEEFHGSLRIDSTLARGTHATIRLPSES